MTALPRPRLGRLRSWAVVPTAASIGASALAALTTLVVARGIGAAAFGQFTLVISIALIVTVVMLMSLHFVLYQELPRAEPSDRPRVMATAVLVVGLLIAVVMAAALVAAPILTRLLGVDARTLFVALAVAVSLTVNQLADSLLRGLRRFTFVAMLKLAVAVLYLGVAGFALLRLGIRDPSVYLGALIVTNVLFALMALAAVPPRWRLASPALARSLLRHGLVVTVIAALSSVAFGVDIILLNHWAPPADVGVFSVYNGLPKRLLGVVFTEGIGLVLLPTLALMDKPALLRRITRLAPAVAAAAAILSLAASALILPLLGDQYPYSIGLMALAAAGIGTHTVYNLYFFALTMDGLRGARLMVRALAIGLPIVLLTQAALIAGFGLIGGLVAFPVTNLLLLAAVFVTARPVYRESA